MVDLYPHQRQAVKELSNGKILVGGVGSGKSRTALAYAVRKEPGRKIYIITTARKRDSLDWLGEALPFEEITEPPVVDSWQNISKYEEVKGAFFILDEQRLVGSGKWAKSFLKIAAHNRWILLSATPGDTWLDYIPVFIANGYYKNRTEFKREHVVYKPYSKFPQVDRYVGVGRLVRYRNAILVEMPDQRHTRRHLHFVDVDYNVKEFEKVWKHRWNVYENKPCKDIAELFRVARKVVNSDPSRISKLLELLENHPKVIVFYNFDYELELLREGLRTWQGSATRKLKQSKSDLSEHDHTGNKSLSSSDTQDTKPASTRMDEHSGSMDGPSMTKTEGLSTPSSQIVGLEGLDEEWQREIAEAKASQLVNTRSKDQKVLLSMDSSFLPVDYMGSRTSGGVKTETQTLTIPSGPLTVAEWNGHKHEAIPAGDRWVYLVQYTAGAEAWNCIETDTMVFYSLNHSYKIFEQAQGRIDRMNTPFEDLHYYILKSRALTDAYIWNSIGHKEDFNMGKFSKQHQF